jgi:sporulation protein YlmC with PRC-barrel domain
MKTLHSLSLVAALSLGSTAYAQTQTPPNPTDSSSVSSEQQREAMPATQAAESRLNDSSKTDKHGAKMVGTKVQMSTGENLGEVKEVLRDTRGDPSYAVISHGGVMGMSAKRTAVPWAAVKAAMQGDKLIMDRSQLDQAPVLPNGKTPDASSGTWSRDADLYWRAKVSTATGSDGNTSPSNPSLAPVKKYN